MKIVRVIALLLGVGLLTAALVSSLRGFFVPALWLAVQGAVVILGIVFERWRYTRNGQSRPIGAGWQVTDERFVDPESGRLVEVWFDADSGERRYVDTGRS
jgi:hypothetical protein